MGLAAVEHKLQVNTVRFNSFEKGQDTHFDFVILKVLNCLVSGFFFSFTSLWL